MKTELHVRKAVLDLWDALIEFVPANYRKIVEVTSWVPKEKILEVLAQHLVKAYKAGLADSENNCDHSI